MFLDSTKNLKIPNSNCQKPPPIEMVEFRCLKSFINLELLLFSVKMGLSGLKQEEYYKIVHAEGLTPDELRLSRLPDNSLEAIVVEFTSQNGKHFEAHHIYNKKGTPYIRLFSRISMLDIDRDEDELNFLNVQKIVARETNSVPEGVLEEAVYVTEEPVTLVSSRIRVDILLKQNLTQSVVAEFVERYMGHFEDVRVPKAFFRYVPKSAYESSGLSLEKLSHS